MRHIAIRLGPVAMLAAITALAATAELGGIAVAATQPPAISSSFTPTLIGVGQTAAVGFTITDPNASGTLSSVGFTDTLSGGGVIDNPNGQTSSGCGTNVVVSATPGTNTITVSGASVKAGTPCIVSAAVTDSSAETVTSQTSVVSSSAGNSNSGSSTSLTVLESPTVTIVTPKANAKYPFGQNVRVNYSCTQAAYAVGLEACTAQDDLGNVLTSGGLLDTKVAGAHELTVQAISVAGVTDNTVDYTVLPDNQFTITHVRTAGATVHFTLKLPGAGKVQVTELSGKHTLSSKSFTVHGKESVVVSFTPGAAGETLLEHGGAKPELRVAFTPKGGVARTERIKV